MKAKRILVGIVLSVSVTMLYAQKEKLSFDEYRKGVLERYDIQRKSVLDGYSEYLKGVWKDYQSFLGEKANIVPKPDKQPIVRLNDTPVSSKPWRFDTIPAANVSSLDKTIIPLKTFPNLQAVPKSTCTFYGLEIELSQIENKGELTSSTSTDIASFWKMLQDKHVGSQWISAINSVVVTYGFNNWLEIDLARHCINQVFAKSTTETRMVFTHFLLSHLGYDVRLGITNMKQMVLLVPFQQMVYGRTFIKLHDTKYYIYYDDLEEQRGEQIPVVSTCEIPETVNRGQGVDLVFRRPVTLPANKWRNFNITDGRLVIKGAVSETLIKMLSHYPQMSVPCYAISVLQPELRNSIVEQVRSQIGHLNELDAVNAILRFVQYGFQYATDGQQFGYEKPFFMEELLYYPQCDCEDRSVFYAYLLRYALGLECHLVKFPGHECVAVKLSQPVEGNGYVYKETYYSISDPTYIGALTGMCMPDYVHERPSVECW